MRKTTNPRSPKQTASHSNHFGLIVGAISAPLSAGAEPALDNRSHRTFQVCRRAESDSFVARLTRAKRASRDTNKRSEGMWSGSR